MFLSQIKRIDQRMFIFRVINHEPYRRGAVFLFSPTMCTAELKLLQVIL